MSARFRIALLAETTCVISLCVLVAVRAAAQIWGG